MSRAIPLPPSSTMRTSNEPPRTLWMGDLDPSFDEHTIQKLWNSLGLEVTVKLIRAKKNLLIPCSSTMQDNLANTEECQKPIDQTGFKIDMHFKDSDATSNVKNNVRKLQKVKINGVSFIDPSTNQLHHSGYCFVEFDSLSNAQYALSFNSRPIPNILSSTMNTSTNMNGQRIFRLNWASGATLQSSIPTTPEFSLFVGDLSPLTTEADLLTLFQKQYRSVKTVRVMTDPITGASRCFGFVRFGDEEERKKALCEMNGVFCRGRYLRVAFATPRNNLVNSNSFSSSGSKLNDNYASLKSVDNNTTVFVGGISSTVNETTLKLLFQNYGNIIQVKIPADKNCGFIKFESKAEAEKAIESLHGFVLDGNPIRLSWGKVSASNSSKPMFGPLKELENNGYEVSISIDQPEQQYTYWRNTNHDNTDGFSYRENLLSQIKCLVPNSFNNKQTYRPNFGQHKSVAQHSQPLNIKGMMPHNEESPFKQINMSRAFNEAEQSIQSVPRMVNGYDKIYYQNTPNQSASSELIHEDFLLKNGQAKHWTGTPIKTPLLYQQLSNIDTSGQLQNNKNQNYGQLNTPASTPSTQFTDFKF